MENLKLIKMLAPEIIDTIELRYNILRAISHHQPIGRRNLSDKLNLQERTIRNEANLLKEQGLLNVEVMGMSITSVGREILDKLHPVYIDLKGIPELEVLLEEELNISKVSIVPGDFNLDSTVIKDMGKLASKRIKDLSEESSTIGITGGTTMAVVADQCICDNKKRNVTILPARGGLGKNIYTQSNSIAVNLAEKLGGNYRLLYVIDGLEEEILKQMAQNTEIKEVLDLIEGMDALIFGIGRADTMARRRQLPESRINMLVENGAVAEAFGHYFDINGREVWEYKTIGISLDKYKKIDRAIAVAGGEEKAEAIIAISTLNNNLELVTDELTAKKILEIKNKN